MQSEGGPGSNPELPPDDHPTRGSQSQTPGGDVETQSLPRLFDEHKRGEKLSSLHIARLLRLGEPPPTLVYSLPGVLSVPPWEEFTSQGIWNEMCDRVLWLALLALNSSRR